MQVVGKNLRARATPIEGRLVVETNGGIALVMVRVEVPSISFPGSTGGGSNNGSSFDPGRGMVFATARNVATIGQLSAMLSSDVLPSRCRK